MLHSPPTISLVVPTIGRYNELRRMLQSVAAQTRIPEQVLIVGEGEQNNEVAAEFPQLNAQFIPLPGSSICEARNAGTAAARSGVDLIAFMDDDIVLEQQAIEAVLRFWDSAPADLGGTSLNLLNDSPKVASWLKRRKITSRLGLYGATGGAVSRSGFHVPFGRVWETIYVSWLPTYCVVYAKHVLEEDAFDSFFKGYSYLEDLDLSYRIGKRYHLAVVADARFYHYPSQIGRPNWYLFGKKEVINRLYFVGKHRELSRPLCCLALCIRSLMTILHGLLRPNGADFKRAAGNVAGLFLTLKGGFKPV
jgi:glycosyltransferase involved in cell wall biosynthesis